MNILKVHNRYRLHGGESESVEAEVALLEAAGHQVVLWEVDNASFTSRRAWLAGLGAPWSPAAYRTVRSLIRQNRPQVLAVHNFLPLVSPAVYYAAGAEGVAVVQSLHNYRIICPAATLFRQGRPCQACTAKSIAWPGLLHRCYRGSFGATAAVVATNTLHRWLGTWHRRVDMYIAPSTFVRHKFLEAGFPADRLAVKPNFLWADPGPGDGSGGYVFYAGRLAPEKGVATLLAAYRRLAAAPPLEVAGTGPLLARLAGEHPGTHWLGARRSDEVRQLMKRAAVFVCPSECPESFGRVVIEAFAAGTPVIASEIGALPELIEHGRTGLLFRPGDAEDLAAKIDWFFSHPNQARAMRREARAEFEARYTAERNYPLLMEIYERAIRHRRAAGNEPAPAPDDPRHARGRHQLLGRYPTGD